MFKDDVDGFSSPSGICFMLVHIPLLFLFYLLACALVVLVCTYTGTIFLARTRLPETYRRKSALFASMRARRDGGADTGLLRLRSCSPVLRIRDIFVRIRSLGSVWYL
jgi:hypothetical protein